MTIKDLEFLYAYDDWANNRLFDVLAHIAPDEFMRPVAGSYGSIRNTMVHVVSAQAGWLDRCGGPERGPRLDPEDFPTVTALKQASESVRAQVRHFLANLEDDALARDCQFTLGAATYSMPLGQLMQHAATHGVHHRGQVALLLRLLGHSPGNFDLLFYLAQ